VIFWSILYALYEMRNAQYSTEVSSPLDLAQAAILRMFRPGSPDAAQRLAVLRVLGDLDSFVFVLIARTLFYRGMHRTLGAGHYTVDGMRMILGSEVKVINDSPGSVAFKETVEDVFKNDAATAKAVLSIREELIDVMVAAMWMVGLVRPTKEIHLFCPDDTDPLKHAIAPMRFLNDEGHPTLALYRSVAYSVFRNEASYKRADFPLPASRLGTARFNGEDTVAAVMSLFKIVSLVVQEAIFDPVDALRDVVYWTWNSVRMGPAPINYRGMLLLAGYANFWLTTAAVDKGAPSRSDIDTTLPRFSAAMKALKEHPNLLTLAAGDVPRMYNVRHVETSARDIVGPVLLERNHHMSAHGDAVIATQTRDPMTGTTIINGHRAVPSLPPMLCVSPAVADRDAINMMELLAGAPIILSTVQGDEFRVLSMCTAGRIGILRGAKSLHPVLGKTLDSTVVNPPELDEGITPIDDDADVGRLPSNDVPDTTTGVVVSEDERDVCVLYVFAAEPSYVTLLHQAHMTAAPDGSGTYTTPHPELVIMCSAAERFGATPYPTFTSLVSSTISPRTTLKVRAGNEKWVAPYVKLTEMIEFAEDVATIEVDRASTTTGVIVRRVVRKHATVKVALAAAFRETTIISSQSVLAHLSQVYELHHAFRAPAFMLEMVTRAPAAQTVVTLNNVTKADMYVATFGRAVDRSEQQVLAISSTPLLRRSARDVRDLATAMRADIRITMAAHVGRVLLSAPVVALEDNALAVLGLSRPQYDTYDVAVPGAIWRAAAARAMLEASCKINLTNGKNPKVVDPRQLTFFRFMETLYSDQDVLAIAASQLLVGPEPKL
jgi:hypothetical protein